ncbi:MAG: hypothetical protein GX046_03165 [Tissierellia bacterium]|nr:hypothetical protein [Tissierellia bacterium]
MEKKRNAAIIYIALISMLIDHIGVLFFPAESLFRSIGRLAFPIFAWSLAQGFRYSSNRSAYFKRLLLFAFISQVPYSFLNPGAIFELYGFNQLFQFVLSFMVLYLYEEGKNKKSLYLLGACLVFLPDLVEYFYPLFSIGYGSYGIMLSLLFYMVQDPYRQALGYILVSLYGSLSTMFIYGLRFSPSFLFQGIVNMDGLFFQWRSIVALPLIYLTERLPGRKIPKYLVYWFYPVHIALLVLLYKTLY